MPKSFYLRFIKFPIGTAVNPRLFLEQTVQERFSLIIKFFWEAGVQTAAFSLLCLISFLTKISFLKSGKRLFFFNCILNVVA